MEKSTILNECASRGVTIKGGNLDERASRVVTMVGESSSQSSFRAGILAISVITTSYSTGSIHKTHFSSKA